MFHQKKGRASGWFAGAVAATAVLTSCFNGPDDRELDLFTYNAADGIRSLDPARATDLETLWIVDQMYEGLLEFDDDLGVVPALADRWSVSEDGLTYAFGLRPGVQFHDGSAFTAQDVVLSFERMLNPANALPGRWVLSGLAKEDGVRAVGTDSVELRLDAPNPVFASLLATPQASILCGGGAGAELQSEEVGTGPFVLKGWLPETAMVLHRHGGYWKQDATGRALPLLDGVRIEFNREEGGEMLGFRQGRYDFVSAPKAEWMEVFFDDSGAWRSGWEGRFVRHSVPFLKTDYIGILVDSASCAEMGLSPLDARVRRAMSMVIDRTMLIRELRAGGASAPLGFVPTGMPGFGQDDRPRHPSLRHDPDAARDLLAEVGVGIEPPLNRLSVGILGTKPSTAELAAALQHAWAEYGIDVDIDVAPSGIDAERVANSEIPLFRKSWLADYPDAENFLGLFDSGRWTPGGPNYTRFSDAAVDSLLQRAANLPNGPERIGILQAVEGRVLDAMPVIPLWHDDVVHLVSRQWQGWKVTAHNRLDLRHVERMPSGTP